MPENITTFPNQRIVRIHREHPTSNFLGIKNENWTAASRDLGPYGLQLYLYLAANADNYTLALSPAAIRMSVGLAKSTYTDHFADLVNKGYLVKSGGNLYDFYERPRDDMEEKCMSALHGQLKGNNTADGFCSSSDSFNWPQDNIEINKNTINNNINIGPCEKQVSHTPVKFEF